MEIIVSDESKFGFPGAKVPAAKLPVALIKNVN